ncbi:hypothetical protein ACFV9W_22155 [Streptomyces sp. NPDC059897]|uniref:hypothetical protein n=1 Tax=Streptomyces sp. NPDC059897 TaxID=3346994 RepID=UPI0036602A40
MSSQHPRPGDEPVVPGVVYDPDRAAHAYDGYVDPAAAHGWQEPADAAGDTAPLPRVPAKGPAHARDNAVFAGGSGRRRRLMRVGGVTLGGVCVVFLGAVVTGLFGSDPSSGPLPWSGDEDARKQRAEHSAPASTGPAPDPSGSVSRPGPSATPTGTAGPSAKEKAADPAASPSTSTTAAPTATASTTAPARGNSGNNPGRGNTSPGAGKGPK